MSITYSNCVRLQKDPLAIADYTFDWDLWLTDVSDTIDESTWTADSGITIVTSSNTTTTATVRLRGGTVGKIYRIANKITTASKGLVELRSFDVVVLNR